VGGGGVKMVQRYDPELFRCENTDSQTAGMMPSNYGDYVLYSDYESLEDECSQLKAKLKRLEKMSSDMFFEF
jgi:hypothetical protein